MNALWSITAKNTDCSTGPLARPFAPSLPRGTVNDWKAIFSVFFPIFDHSGMIQAIIQKTKSGDFSRIMNLPEKLLDNGKEILPFQRYIN